MEYAAIMLCPDGGIVRHQDTQEVASVLIGDFELMTDAVNQACLALDCSIIPPIEKGIISKGYGKGGYMLITTQNMGDV